ncbi:MAG: polysaccharide pyruvyl transferase family protein [Gemmatimonadota bacterium]
MRSVTLLDTATASTNLGDQIIMEAVRREIDELCPDAFQYSIVSHEWMGARSRRLLQRSDVAIVGGSNLLSSRMWFKPLWKISPAAAIRRSEIVLMGCGWYQYQSPADLYSRLLLKRLLSRRYLHAVRDSQALRMLTAAGIANVINTGCPTLWTLTPERCTAVPSRKAGSVVTTLNTYIKDRHLDRELLTTLRARYDRVFFWTQTEEDSAYARELDPGLVFLRPSLAAFDALLQSEPDLDYVGNRLHAGIRALQFGRRSIIVEIDNRARAMGEDIDLPTVERGDMARLIRMIEAPFETRLNLPFDAIERWRAQFRLA